MAEQITLNVPDRLAAQVREVAASTQRELEDVLLEWIDQGSQKNVSSPLPSAPSEAELLQQVNVGFSEEWWAVYRGFIAQRQAETIRDVDLVQLIDMSEALETANVQRLQALATLAQRRDCTIEQVMESLGIQCRADV